MPKMQGQTAMNKWARYLERTPAWIYTEESCRQGFRKIFSGCQYGREATQDAFYWFLQGREAKEAHARAEEESHARAALLAYAQSCEAEYPLLAKDVRRLAMLPPVTEGANHGNFRTFPTSSEQ